MKAEFKKLIINDSKRIIGNYSFYVNSIVDKLPKIADEEREAPPALPFLLGKLETNIDLYDDEDSVMGDFKLTILLTKNEILKKNNIVSVSSDENQDIFIRIENFYLDGTSNIYVINKPLFEIEDITIGIDITIETFSYNSTAKVTVDLYETNN